MAMIAINSATLAAAVREIEQGCSLLECIYDADDIDDVDYYAQQIRRAVDGIRALLASAEPAAGADHADRLRECIKTLEDSVYFAAVDHGLPGTAAEIKGVVQLLEQIAAEGVKP